VARDEQRHQLVAQLVVAHRRPVLVGRQQQHREDVVALGQVGHRAAAGDLIRDHRVELAHHRPVLRQAADALRAGSHEQQEP